MDQMFESILSKLDIYEKHYTQYTRCLIRGREILMSNKPEEIVRQGFLHFLLHHTNLTSDLIDIKVEYNNLDIAIYQKHQFSDFRPFHPPIVIVEVKRQEENLCQHEQQLEQYLIEHKCARGILFNGSSLTVLEHEDGKHFSKTALASLVGVPDLLLKALDVSTYDLIEFEKAKNGDVKSFITLCKKYGKHTLHTFQFLVKGNFEPISGCCFSYDQERVHYDMRGKYQSKKKLSFRYQDFDRLLSIVY